MTTQTQNLSRSQLSNKEQWQKMLLEQEQQKAKNQEIALKSIDTIQANCREGLSLKFCLNNPKAPLTKLVSEFSVHQSLPETTSISPALISQMLKFGNELVEKQDPVAHKFVECAQRAAIARAMVPAGDNLDDVKSRVLMQQRETKFVLSLAKSKMTG